MSRYDLVLDDEPYSPEEASAAERRREGLRRVKTVGWIWVIHGGLLCGISLLLLLTYGLARFLHGLITGGVARNLRPSEQDQIDYLMQVTGQGLWLVPVMLVVGAVVLVVGIAFLRRRPWSWPVLHVVSWLHVFGLLPAVYLTSVLFADLEQPQNFDALYYRLAGLLDWVLLLATQVLVVWVTLLLRKSVVRELYGSEDDDEAPAL